MHAAGKIIIGLIFIIIGLGLFVDSVTPISGGRGMFGIDWLKNFVVVVTGVVPIFLILVGLFVVWLEVDELKAQQEIQQEQGKKKASKKR